MCEKRRFVARLTAARLSIDELLAKNLRLDVWERKSDFLIVAADDSALAEIARSGIARVEELYEVKDFLRSKSED
jgi:hypothetical protein